MKINTLHIIHNFFTSGSLSQLPHNDQDEDSCVFLTELLSSALVDLGVARIASGSTANFSKPSFSGEGGTSSKSESSVSNQIKSFN